MRRRWKSGRIEKNLVFSYLCLVGRMEKWRDESLFVWLRRKMRGWKIEVSINLQLCPH